MTMELVNKPVVTLAHVISTIGLFIALLASVNSTENKVVETETRQQTIIETQKEFKKDFKDYQSEQRAVQSEQMKLLHQIKGKLEK